MARQKRDIKGEASQVERVTLIMCSLIMLGSLPLLYILFYVPLVVYLTIGVLAVLVLLGKIKDESAKRFVLVIAVVGALSALYLLWAYRWMFIHT